MIGLYLDEAEKDMIRQIAANHRITMSKAAKILMMDNAMHLAERNLFKS